MKVPVYRNQARLPKQLGQGLQVQASPGQFAQVSRAQEQFGSNLISGAMNLYGDFLKTERVREQAEKTASFTNVLNKQKTMFERSTPDTWVSSKLDQNGSPIRLNYFDYVDNITKSMMALKVKELSGVTDKATRARLDASFSQSISAAMTNIKSSLRSKFVDHSRSQIKKLNDQQLNEISDMAEGPDKQFAIDQAKKSVAYWQSLAPLKQEWLYRTEKNFENNIGELAINKAIRAADTSDAVQEIADQLRSPTKDYPHKRDIERLNAETKDKFLEQLARKSTNLINKEGNADLKEIKANRTRRKERRENTVDGISARISVIRDAVSRNIKPGEEGWPADTKGNPLKMPTETDIAENTTLKQSQRDQLTKQLRGEDRVYNATYVAAAINDIDDAVTNEDLNELLKGYRAAAEDNYIGGRAFKELRIAINSKRTNNPEYQERSDYKTLLRNVMRMHGMSNDGTIIYSGSGTTVAKMRSGFEGASALIYFNAEVQKGVRPSTAFWQAVSKFQDDKLVMVQSQLKTMPTLFNDEVIKNPKKLLTQNDVDNARINLREALNTGGRLGEVAKGLIDDGKTPSQKQLGAAQRSRKESTKISKAERMTIRQMVGMENILNFIETYAKLDPKQRNMTEESPADPGMSTDKGKKSTTANKLDLIRQLIGVD